MLSMDLCEVAHAEKASYANHHRCQRRSIWHAHGDLAFIFMLSAEYIVFTSVTSFCNKLYLGTELYRSCLCGNSFDCLAPNRPSLWDCILCKMGYLQGSSHLTTAVERRNVVCNAGHGILPRLTVQSDLPA